MRLASLRTGGRDGTLVVVSPDGARYAEAASIAATMQAALDDWDRKAPLLEALAKKLAAGEVEGAPLDVRELHSPLPRAYEWVDGSAFLNHVILVRKARGAEPPATLETDPLVYQGGSGDLLAPTDDIVLREENLGLDFEAEVAVILGDVPMGANIDAAGKSIKLLCLVNDVTLRNLVPEELAKGFGFFRSKPATAFSPFAVTPDEVGDAFHDGRLHLDVVVTHNGVEVGHCNAGKEMHFSFLDLITFIARTRRFTAGTILGSGTVSNVDRARGISCLAERRMIETIEGGKPVTPFMKAGDTISIEVEDAAGKNVFGTISQRVVAPAPEEKRP